MMGVYCAVCVNFTYAHMASCDALACRNRVWADVTSTETGFVAVLRHWNVRIQNAVNEYTVEREVQSVKSTAQ